LDGAVSHWLGQAIEHAILTCCPPHDHFYYGYGFKRLVGTERRHHPELGRDVDCLHIERSFVPEEVAERLDPFVARLAARGDACLCRSFPNCVPNGFVSGRFGGTDVFCPIRAGEILDRTKARD
jgi:hypothetical protein